MHKEIDMSKVAILCSAKEGMLIFLYFILGLLPFIKLNFDLASSFYIFPKSSGNT